jgi:phage-related protein
VKDRAHEEATALAAQAKEAGTSAVEKTKDVASSVVQRMGDMASTIGHKTEGAVDSVGGEMKSLAGTIRDNAPKGGVFGSAASGVASTLESGGAYLQDHNLHGMAGDTTALIRRYPLQAILAGIGVGFLIGRVSRS